MTVRAHKDDLDLEQLSERLQELEERVAALEMSRASPANPPVEAILGTLHREREKPATSISVVPVLGKAVLAIAGAYLLRATAESGAVTRWFMLVVGIVYGGFWLLWAVQSHRHSHFSSTIFALTAAIILPPLLWEGTVRFQVLTVGFASAVLVVVVLLSLWER